MKVQKTIQAFRGKLTRKKYGENSNIGTERENSMLIYRKREYYYSQTFVPKRELFKLQTILSFSQDISPVGSKVLKYYNITFMVLHEREYTKEVKIK